MPDAADSTRPATTAHQPSAPEPVWAGRLRAGLDPRLRAFTTSLTVDQRLLAFDIAASTAHVRMLGRQGVIAADDAAAIEQALVGISIDGDEQDEDVHSLIERRLVERLGETGKRIHAGRSRNDQVVTALRLWARAAARELVGAAAELQSVLVARATSDGDAVLPGYTHLQRAQPVTLGHHLAAHAWALERDAQRFRGAYDSADTSPLGAGALAGSSLDLDPAWVARQLGFREAFQNSLDAVADRDFCLDLAYACTVCLIHLSRIGEELVLWTSQEFGFAALDDHAATGSSMMPQKKNPDVAELLRGRCGIAIGRLCGLLAMLKALPLAYNRDLQEDKQALFEQVDATLACLEAATIAYASIRFDTVRMAAAAGDGLSVATDAAEQLVREGMAFRDAHATIAARVAAGERFASPTAAEAVAARTKPGMPGSYTDQLGELARRVAENRTYTHHN